MSDAARAQEDRARGGPSRARLLSSACLEGPRGSRICMGRLVLRVRYSTRYRQSLRPLPRQRGDERRQGHERSANRPRFDSGTLRIDRPAAHMCGVRSDELRGGLARGLDASLPASLLVRTLRPTSEKGVVRKFGLAYYTNICSISGQSRRSSKPC
jgi:hypothetical protein